MWCDVSMPALPAELHAPGRLWAIGAGFARGAFLHMLAYRVRYLVGVANYLLYVSVNYYITRTVFETNPGALAPIMDDGELVTYFAVGWAARAAYFNNIDSKLAEQVSSGQLAMELIRPAPLPWMRYSETLGETAFRFLFMSVPTMILLWIVYHPKLLLPATWVHGLAFIIAFVLAVHIYFAINFLTGLIAVFTLKIQGFLWAKFLIVQLLSGLLVPLSFIRPGWLRDIVEMSPFAFVAHTPLMIYLGKVTADDLLGKLAWQSFWTLALLGLCAWAWSLTVRKVSIQGG